MMGMEVISYVDFWAFLSFALLGSFGHCIGMCGGIVLSYSAHIKTHPILSHTLYSLGRIGTYTILGAIMGAIGAAFKLSAFGNVVLFVSIGVILVLLGFSLLFGGRLLGMFEGALGRLFPVQNLFKKILSKGHFGGLFLLGVLNGFLPCGFLYIALLSAAGSGNMFSGALTMIIFGICTLLPLLFVGMFANFINQTKLRNIALKLAGIAVIVSGILFAQQGITRYLNPTQSMQHQQHHHHH